MGLEWVAPAVEAITPALEPATELTLGSTALYAPEALSAPAEILASQGASLGVEPILGLGAESISPLMSGEAGAAFPASYAGALGNEAAAAALSSPQAIMGAANPQGFGLPPIQAPNVTSPLMLNTFTGPTSSWSAPAPSWSSVANALGMAGLIGSRMFAPQPQQFSMPTLYPPSMTSGMPSVGEGAVPASTGAQPFMPQAPVATRPAGLSPTAEEVPRGAAPAFAAEMARAPFPGYREDDWIEMIRKGLV